MVAGVMEIVAEAHVLAEKSGISSSIEFGNAGLLRLAVYDPGRLLSGKRFVVVFKSNTALLKIKSLG